MLVAVDEAIESDDDTELSLDCVRVAVGRRLEGAVEKGEATLPDEENPPKLDTCIFKPVSVLTTF